MSDALCMKAADLARRLCRLAIRCRWEIGVREGGSHTRITLNSRQTTVPRHAKDLGTGLFQAIRKQLGLLPEDLE